MPPFNLVFASDFHFAKNAGELGAIEVWNKAKESPSLWGRMVHLAQYLRHRATSHDADAAEAFAFWVHQNRKKIDLLVLGGDLATTVDDDDLEEARKFVFEPVDASAPQGYFWSDQDKKPTLATIQPVVVIPGNHDRYDGAFCAPGGTNYDRYFPPGGSSIPDWPKSRVRRLFEKNVGPFRVILIGADFTLPKGDYGTNPLSTFLWPGEQHGQGRAVDTVVNELVTETNDAVDESTTPCVLLWVIHFDPRCKKNHLELLGRDLLHDNVRYAKQVDAVLCGHTHEAEVGPAYTMTHPDQRGRAVRVLVCGSTTQFIAPAHTFLSLKIDAANDPPVTPLLHTLVKTSTGKHFQPDAP